MLKAKRKIINIDDPDLVIEFKDEDFNSEFLKETRIVKKQVVKSTKNIIKKILDSDDEVKVENVNKNEHDKLNNLFEYEGKNVLMFVDKDGKPWCKGKDIATILQYKDTKSALLRHVDVKYKKSFAELGEVICTPLLKVDPQTIFITRTGIMQLVSRSKMPKAIEFFEWIAEEVIPQLLEYGTYTMKSSKGELDKLTKDFYAENDLMDYADMHVVYLAYIGMINGQHVLKFGVTGDYARRELDEHRKTFESYNVIKIWPSTANYAVENKIKKEMRGKKVLMKYEKKTELIALNGVFTVDKCVKSIDKIVQNTKSKYEEDNERIIKKLQHENQMLNDKIVLLNDKISNYAHKEKSN